MPSTLKREREQEFSITPHTTKSIRHFTRKMTAPRTAAAPTVAGSPPRDENCAEPGDDQDLLHGHGELGHRKRRPGRIGERTFLKLLLGLGLIKRQLAEFHEQAIAKAMPARITGDRRVDGAAS